MIRTENGNGRALGLAGLALTAFAMTGCSDGPALLKRSADTAAPGTGSGTGPVLAEQDVESPEVFEAEEAALWDGRPSLGGIWVAHPDVTDPQRVLIRNNANDREVIGALFRRERDIPGPRIQASSEAAEALAMLAGAPVQLSVVALVRQEAPAASDTHIEPMAPDSQPRIATDISSEALADAILAPETPTLDAAHTPAKRRFRWPWSKPDPAPLSAFDPVPAVSMAAAPPLIEAMPLAPQTALEKPYVQIGAFDLRENADRAATRMRAAGLTPSVHQNTADGRTIWRVLIGPATTPEQSAALMETVAAQGISDAYFVTN